MNTETKMLRNIKKMEPWLGELIDYLKSDEETQAILEEANTLVTRRLGFNDHGPVHSAIVAHNAVVIYRLLEDAGIVHTFVSEGHTREFSLSAVVVGAYLHDSGNAIHRERHYLFSPIVSSGVVERVGREVLGLTGGELQRFKLRVFEIMYAHDEAVQCMSTEAGCVSVADGTDMEEGRARHPYSRGKIDIHSVSALAITRVIITHGKERPVAIKVHMNSHAGIFQIQNILGAKIKSSGLKDMIELYYRHLPSKTEAKLDID